VLVRVDLNVPLENGKVTDTTRIERVAPTIREIADKGGKVILLSHFGQDRLSCNIFLTESELVNRHQAHVLPVDDNHAAGGRSAFFPNETFQIRNEVVEGEEVRLCQKGAPAGTCECADWRPIPPVAPAPPPPQWQL
jgi:hypothetical protein